MTASFDIQAPGSSEPRVEVTQTVGGRWRIDVTVDTDDPWTMQRSAPETIHVSRRELAEDMASGSLVDLSPSLPVGGDIPIDPDMDIDAEPFLIRFGELRYRPTTVFKPDGRRPYYDERYPWRCLVRITTPLGWSGSGVLIGPRHVLTASHSVDWTPGWLQVDVLYSNGRSLAQAQGTSVYYETKVAKDEISDEESDEDYAVVVLDQPLGERFGWMGSRRYDSGWDDEQRNWRNIGYPQDFSPTGELAVYQRDFLLNELGADYGSARLIRSDTFDNWPGQSGSPIFGFWTDGPYVVGVVSGEGSNYNYISGGSLLPALVSKARTQNP